MCFNHVPAIFYQIFIFSPNDSTSKRHSTIKAGTPEHGTTEHETMAEQQWEHLVEQQNTMEKWNM